MNKQVKGWTLVGGLLLLAAAASHAFVTPDFPVPPPAADEGGIGPDVIVGSIFDTARYGPLNGMEAFAIGTESCNVGDQTLDWISNNNRHPVIAQNMYRLHDGRFEMIGMSWLKHGFAALNNSLCGTCSPTPGDSLGVGCSDPYWASLNGSQGNLGPRSEVNAATGVFSYPFGGPPANDVLDKRLIVAASDLNSANYPGAQYFVEGHYVTQDDAAAGNKDNNASYRQINITGSSPSFNISLTGLTERMKPAILAWADNDSNVSFAKVFDPVDDGLIYVAWSVTDNGNGTWHYEYAVFNMNADRSIRAFGVPIPAGVNLTNLGKRIPQHHSGEPYVDYNWKAKMKSGYQAWATKNYGQNSNANALRWSTMANFRFDADQPPVNVDCGMEMFKPGTPKRIFFPAVGPDAP